MLKRLHDRRDTRWPRRPSRWPSPRSCGTPASAAGKSVLRAVLTTLKPGAPERAQVRAGRRHGDRAVVDLDDRRARARHRRALLRRSHVSTR